MLEQLSRVTGGQVQVVHVVGGDTDGTYEPSATQSSEETYDRFLAVTGLGSQRPAHAEV